MASNNVDWRKVLSQATVNVSSRFDLEIFAEDFILREISDRISIFLDHIDYENPNVAKIAGIVAFWVRKLKPFCFAS